MRLFLFWYFIPTIFSGHFLVARLKYMLTLCPGRLTFHQPRAARRFLAHLALYTLQDDDPDVEQMFT